MTLFDRKATFSTERLGALSDGLFAIVLTLLVLDLKVPELPSGYREQEMIADLAALLPNFAAWLISFLLLARIWVVHHGIIASLSRCHVGTIAWNFVVLGLCSLVPFSAGLIGTYEWDPLAIIIFSALFGLVGLAIGMLARHAATEFHLLRSDDAVVDLRRHWRYHTLAIPSVALISIAAIPVAEVVSLGVWIIEPAVAWATGRVGGIRKGKR